jgi:hypothetical protein
VTVVRRTRVVAVALATACALFVPVAAGGAPPTAEVRARSGALAEGPERDTVVGHPDDAKLVSLPAQAAMSTMSTAEAATAAEALAATPAQVGAQRRWAAIDFVEGSEYLKEYTLRGIGDHIEVWVASDADAVSFDVAFPRGDCRNDERVQITDEQVQYLISEYDGRILPLESEAFSVAPDRDGSQALLPQLAPSLGFPQDYWAGEGDNVVVLVDNVRDENFYDTDLAGGNVTYTAGFFYSTFNEYFDRNVMTIDAFDWLHRTGANPPDEPVPGDLCASKPARPFTYESTFAHEYQHLLEYYEDPAETSWINEGLSMYAEEVTGYASPDLPITDIAFDGYIQCLLGNSEIQTPANPNPREGGPENSLTWWGDQGQDSEILCDYGAAFAFMLHLDHRFGEEFLTALHRDDLQGLESLQALLDERGITTSARTLIHQWSAMLALDAPLEVAGTRFLTVDRSNYSWQRLDRTPYQTPRLHAAINWDNDDAWSTPGAPPNGSDYVRLRTADGGWLAARDMRRFEFDGADVLPTAPTEWTVAAEPPEHAGDPALWSGSGENFDRAAIFDVTVPAEDPTLTFETLFETEAFWDFGFVQVSTDGGATWTSLANDLTTTDHDPGAIPGVVQNLPGLTGSSGGWVSTAFDLAAYSGQEILLSFRYITDPSLNEPGWWVDDITVGGVLVNDGTTLDGIRSQSEVLPTPVAGFTVQLVGYSSTGAGPAFLVELQLDDAFDSSWTLPNGFPRRQIRDVDVVAAIVSYDEPTETVTQYAPYTLTVNGVVQPGGSAPAA